MFRTCCAIFALSLAAIAQTTTSGSIQASGSATISGIQPDQVQLTVGVTTTAATAQNAASQNATAAGAVIAALKSVLGANGTVQTISYTLYPQYTVGAPNQPSVITGYTATNTVQVTTSTLNLAGPLIDAANAAGANTISGPSYSLQNSDPYLQQALTAATKQALAHASAIAAGLGAKTGAILSAQEGGSTVPSPTPLGATSTGGTPIQNGTVSVSASVTVTVAISQ